MEKNEINKNTSSENKGPQNNDSNEIFLRIIESPSFDKLTSILNTFVNNLQHSKSINLKDSIYDKLYKVLIAFGCLFSVIFLAVNGILDKTSSGTLIGAIIGYALAKNTNSD